MGEPGFGPEAGVSTRLNIEFDSNSSAVRKWRKKNDNEGIEVMEARRVWGGGAKILYKGKKWFVEIKFGDGSLSVTRNDTIFGGMVREFVGPYELVGLIKSS